MTLLPGEEKIVVLQRGPSGDPSAPEGACFPGEKAAEAAAAGYDAVVLVNRVEHARLLRVLLRRFPGDPHR